MLLSDLHQAVELYLSDPERAAIAREAYARGDAEHTSHQVFLPQLYERALRAKWIPVIPFHRIPKDAVYAIDAANTPCDGSYTLSDDGACECLTLFCVDCGSINAPYRSAYDQAVCNECVHVRDAAAIAASHN